MLDRNGRRLRSVTKRYRAESLNLEASRFVHDVDYHVSATLAYRVILTGWHPAWLADVETVVV